MRQFIISTSDRLHLIMRRVAVFAVCVMFLTVVVQIIARYVFSSPPSGPKMSPAMQWSGPDCWARPCRSRPSRMQF